MSFGLSEKSVDMIIAALLSVENNIPMAIPRLFQLCRYDLSNLYSQSFRR